MTDVVFIYLFCLSQKNVKRIQYFDKNNKIANIIFFLSAILFPIVL